jgi:hypothetical protein
MTLKNLFIVVLLFVSISACHDNDPKKEDVPEMITSVRLTFSNQAEEVQVTATDPDGEGIQGLQIDGPVNLHKNFGYTLRMEIVNSLAQVGDPAHDVAAEIEAEGDEHMFFFSWTEGLFASPTGNGNIDSRNDPVNYSVGTGHVDKNGLPLGLVTEWTAGEEPGSGTFRVLLKHQPGLKSATSSSSDGETDLDLTFTLNVQ